MIDYTPEVTFDIKPASGSIDYMIELEKKLREAYRNEDCKLRVVVRHDCAGIC